MESGKSEVNSLKKLQDGPVNLMSVLHKLVEIVLMNRSCWVLDKRKVLG